MDVLGGGPTDVIESDGLELADLLLEIVVGQAVMDDVEEAAEDTARPLEARRVAPHQAEAGLLELFDRNRATVVNILELFQGLDNRLLGHSGLDGAASGKVRLCQAPIEVGAV